MKKILTFFAFLSILSCDDGDIVVTELDFEDQALELCDNFEYLFYKINPESNESIAFRFTTLEEILGSVGDVDIQLEGENVIVVRKFDDMVTSSYFCNPIPPTTPMVTNELVSVSGLVTVTTMGDREDEDGIPSDIEDPTGALDTDNDGLLDIYDDDDDGDNVPTSAEGVIITNGAIDLGASRDTDTDGTPDYLDNDDDGDGILTLNEDSDGDLDPRNDDSDDTTLEPDYLDINQATFTTIEAYRQHRYFLKNIEVTIVVRNVEFNNVDAEETFNFTDDILNLGVYNAPNFEIIETPDF